MSTICKPIEIKGFTVIELMVIVMIVGMLLVLTVPSFSRFLDSSRLNGAANELIADIHYARSMALTKRRTYHIEFQANRYRIVETSTSEVVRTRNLPSGFAIATSGDPSFFAWGLTEATNITISKGANAKALVLNSNGNVSCN